MVVITPLLIFIVPDDQRINTTSQQRPDSSLYYFATTAENQDQSSATRAPRTSRSTWQKKRGRQKTNGPPLLGLAQHRLEGGVVAVLVEEGGAIHGPVQDVVDVAAGVAAQASWHGGILPPAPLAKEMTPDLPTPFP